MEERLKLASQVGLNFLTIGVLEFQKANFKKRDLI